MSAVGFSLAALTALPGCVPTEVPVSPRAEPTVLAATPDREPTRFQFPGPRQEMTSQSLLGRVTVIGFIATYDVPSQAQMRYLTQLSREHVPRLNVAAIAIEPLQNRDLISAYVDTLGIQFPVGIAESAVLEQNDGFKGINHVPAIVILDAEGRERFRHLGFLSASELETAVETVESGASN